MKATVTITSRGVVTLPAKVRREMGLKPDDQLIVETTPDGVIIRIELFEWSDTKTFPAASTDVWRPASFMRARSQARASSCGGLHAERVTPPPGRPPKRASDST